MIMHLMQLLTQCLVRRVAQLSLLVVMAVLGATYTANALADEHCGASRQEVLQYLGLEQKETSLTCSQVNEALALIHSPKLTISDWEYEGGFRLSTKRAGETENSTVDFSLGIFSLSTSKKSMFVASNPRLGGIGEFLIPPITKSEDLRDFVTGETVLQNFIPLINNPRVLTGIDGYFRITGVKQIDNALMVNYINWYDAPGTETDTSLMIWDANNLAESKMYGPYQLQGAAHAAGWLTEIPPNLIDLFGATHITGSQLDAAISSRLSIGPTAFAFNPRKYVVYGPSGFVETQAMLDFSMKKPLYDRSVYEHQPDYRALSINKDGLNKMWTLSSGASFGFIVPGTRTYLTLGKSAGHESGIGYKIEQSNGHKCGGPCPYDASDYYSFYWAWDVVDLLKAKFNVIQPYNQQPYEHGKFPLPAAYKGLAIGGADYDAEQGRLFIALTKGDTLGKYARPPLFLTYKRKIATQEDETE